MDLGKKENLKTSLLIWGILYMAPAFSGLAIRHNKFFCFNIYKTLTKFVR